MYCILGGLMLIRGFADAIMMRTQQAVAINAPGYLPPEHYNQIFTAHGTIMILFGAMPLVIGLMNFVMPLQLGVRDVAFPTLNSVGFWLTATGALLVNLSLFIGEFARTGWLPYPPLSETTYTPGVGVDYYLWSVQISGIGTLMTGINLVTTVLKMRAPGMSYLRMPMFCWTTLASNLLIISAFPVLTATLAMLTLDRYFGFHFFTNERGGNMMMFVNLIWAWGHPEVYILVLPAFGVFSEIFSTFSGKPLFGYRSMVIATMRHLHPFLHGLAAPLLHHGGGTQRQHRLRRHLDHHRRVHRGEGVQLDLHHVRRPGPLRGPDAVVDGLHLHLRHRGHDRRLLAVPPADFLVHNSLFLVAHFHNVILGGDGVRRLRRHRVLVPQGVRLPPRASPGARRPSGSPSSASGSPSRRSTSWGFWA